MKSALTAHRLYGIAISTKATPEHAIPVGASRFGGRPDVPKDFVWPVATRDPRPYTTTKPVVLPLDFVAQIALSDIAELDRERLLPEDGLLSFFMLDDGVAMDHASWSIGDLARSDRTCVAHFTRDQTLVRRDPPEDGYPILRVTPPPSTGPLRGKTSVLSFHKVETWPQVEGTVIGGGGNDRTAPLYLTQDQWMEWADRAPESPPCAMLGHPVGCEYPIGTDPDSRLLLSLEAKESGLGWERYFGRNGYLFFYARASAIRARNWSAARHKQW